MSDNFNYLDYAVEFVQKIRAKGINILIAKIFGSYSKNSFNENSDLDILLVSDNFVGAGFIDNLLIANELIDYDLIQPKTYSYKDYIEGDPFLNEINKTAITIHNEII